MRAVDIRIAAFYMKTLAALGVRRQRFVLASGEVVRLRTNDLLAKRLVAERWFEPRVRQTLREHTHPGTTFLDIGANIGYYTVQAANLVGPQGRVIAFEPQSAMRQELTVNLALNHLSNVAVYPYALSDQTGTAQFCVPVPGNEGMGSLRRNARFGVSSEIEVETRRLDDVLLGLDHPPVGCVKLDAEGAELLILKGAPRLLSGPHKPHIVFEANENNCEPFGYRVFDLLKAFSDLGYRLTQIDAENWFAEALPPRV
jgi:FkbM family methyltransferase